MKKIISIILMVMIAFPLSAGAYKYTLTDYICPIFGDNMYLEKCGEKKDGMVYIPYTFILELGGEATWDPNTNSIRAKLNGRSIYADINGRDIYTDYETYPDCTYISQDYLMIPSFLITNYWNYNITYYDYSDFYRIHRSEEKLSDLEVFSKYSNQSAQEKAKFETLFQDPKIAKPVFLTFDDGPNKNTEKILNLLKQYDMKATFFMLASGIKNNPETVKRMLDEGHAIALHGTSHQKNAFYKNSYSPANEMNNANTILFETVGVKTSLCRSPYGSKPYLTKSMYQTLKDNGFFLWDWNIDSLDSTSSSISASTIKNHVIASVGKYAVPFVLFHDKAVTATALEDILPYLKNSGYNALPISEDIPLYNWQER